MRERRRRRKYSFLLNWIFFHLLRRRSRPSRPLIPGRSRISLLFPAAALVVARTCVILKRLHFFGGFFYGKNISEEKTRVKEFEKRVQGAIPTRRFGRAVRPLDRREKRHTRAEQQTIFPEIFIIIHTRLNLLKRHSLFLSFSRAMTLLCTYIYIYKYYRYSRFAETPPG